MMEKWAIVAFVSVAISMLESFVAMCYWNWFIAPTVNFRLTLVQWFAVNIILSLFCRHFQPSGDVDVTQQIKALGLFIASPFIALAYGFVIHLIVR